MTMHVVLTADSGGAALPAALALEKKGRWAVTSDAGWGADAVPTAE